MLTALEKEQLNLHYRDSVVEIEENGKRSLLLVECLKNKEDGGVIVGRPLASGLWTNKVHKNLSSTKIRPWFPKNGFYNLPQNKCCFIYKRTSEKQWRKSLARNNGHGAQIITKGLKHKANIRVDDPEAVTSMRNNESVSLGSALSFLYSENWESVAINRDLALLKLLPKSHPLILYKDFVIGFVDTNNDNIIIPSELSEFYEEVVISLDDSEIEVIIHE